MVLTHQLNKSPEEVFRFLTDMELFKTVHPVVQKIEDRGPYEYLVTEKMKLGPIPYRVQYPLFIQSDAGTLWVQYHGIVAGMAHLYMDFNLSGDAKHCTVREDIRFQSLLPVFFMVKPIFKMQHQKLFENIEKADSLM